ncbi:MAG: FHA domain-containing protein [Xanthomonadales bacterium]
MSIYRLKGASGAVINQSFTLGDRTLIGSAADCDLRIDSEGVAMQHAEIIEEDGALILRNLGSPGATLLNGEPVEQASLGSGDEIRIANCRWVLQAPGLQPQKVLTSEAIQPKRDWVLWLIVAGLLAAAALAWQRGMLPF